MLLSTRKMSNPIKKVSKRTKQTFLQRRYQFSSVAQSCPTLCDPVDCSTPSFPVHHQLLELTQTHVHRVGDAIQPPHLLSSPSPPAFNLSQPQGLFQWLSSLHQVAKVLELQHQSFQCIFSTDSFRIDLFDLLVVQGLYRWLVNIWKDVQHHSLLEKCKSKP